MVPLALGCKQQLMMVFPPGCKPAGLLSALFFSKGESSMLLVLGCRPAGVFSAALGVNVSWECS